MVTSQNNKSIQQPAQFIFTRLIGVMPAILFMGVGLSIFATPVLAQDVTNVTTITENIAGSTSYIPLIMSAIAYSVGLIMVGMGILKLKLAAENPVQNTPRSAIIRLLGGGMLLSMPAMWYSLAEVFNSGVAANQFETGQAGINAIFGGFLAGLPTFRLEQDVNELLQNFIDSTAGLPALASLTAYILGLWFGVNGVQKLRDHVDDPSRTTIGEPIVRFLVGGALLALPATYEAMYSSIAGDGDLTGFDWFGEIAGILGGFSMGGSCGLEDGIQSIIPVPIPGIERTLGTVVCYVFFKSAVITSLLTVVAYTIGLFLGIWGILKLKEAGLNPANNSVWDGVSRLIAAGAFFALPFLVHALRNTVSAGIVPWTTTGFNEGLESGFLEDLADTLGVGGIWDAIAGDDDFGAHAGLDAMLARMMIDLYGPVLFIVNFFGYVAGMIFIMIGISRLLKSAQDGARGPAGLGTIATFITGGMLISVMPIIKAVSMTLFNHAIADFSGPDAGVPAQSIATYAQLSYTGGLDEDGPQIVAIHRVISAIVRFMILLGTISFVRGLFIMRSVAEGDQQASTMAGMTHIIGGALAINIGPLINTLQVTLGIQNYGVIFGGNAFGIAN